VKEGIEMKKAVKILISIVVVIVIIIGGGIFYLTHGMKAVADEKINGVELANISDGEYTGKYDSGRFSNEIMIIISDKKIVGLKILQDVTFAKPEVSNALFAQVISKQNTAVDTVSGATVTSKAYLKAIENAFNK
jgi:uncharacterized protein with FMN-binding domain